MTPPLRLDSQREDNDAQLYRRLVRDVCYFYHELADFGYIVGDLDYAKRFGRSCLVLTFVSKNAMGVDYYQPDGARIDIGSISRP